MKKLTTLFLALASLCAAQTTYQYSLYNSGAICSLPGGMPTPGCLPPELWKAGVWVTLHNDDPKVFGFYVTISVTLADGSISTQEQFTKRMATGSGVGYANGLFWFGKMPSDFALPPVKISVMDVPFGPSVEQASPAVGVEYRAAVAIPLHEKYGWKSWFVDLEGKEWQAEEGQVTLAADVTYTVDDLRKISRGK